MGKEVRNINPKDEALVVRSNKFLEARYETTLHQQRIMLWLISEIRPEDRDFQTYRVSIKELAKFVGIEGSKNLYQEMARATGGMVGRVVEIGSLDQDTYIQVSLVSAAKYRIGEGFIDLEVSPTLRPYLLELKENFTKAYLRDLMQMKSTYSIRLYDLLNQYRKIGKRKIEVAELKHMLGIEKKYKDYKNFKARVVKPAVAEINARTDLAVSYVEKKLGRSVGELHFIIQTKTGFREQQRERAGEFVDHNLTSQLIHHGLRDNEARELVALYGETDPGRINYHIAELERGIANGKIKKPVPWLKKAIEVDHRDQKTLFQKDREQAKLEAQKLSEERAKRQKLAAQIRAEMNALESEYSRYRMKFVLEVVEDLTMETQTQWAEEFKNILQPPLKEYWIKHPKWDTRSTLANVEQFIETKIGKKCQEFTDWLRANNKPDYDELALKREALL